MQVIGLTGPARAGKDTIAAMIGREYEGTVIRQGFADKLKLSAARIFNPECDLEFALDWCNQLKTDGSILPSGDIEKNPAITGRVFLQRYGTEAHRNVFGQGFWLDAVLPEGRDDCDLLVIPDVRFDNEARRVLGRGGEVWRVTRPTAEPVEAHASEAGIPSSLVTREVYNNGSLDDLHKAVIEHIGKGRV